MANGSQTVSAVITADAKPFKRAVQDAGSSFDSFGRAAANFGAVAAAAFAVASAAAVTFLAKSVQAAADAEAIARGFENAAENAGVFNDRVGGIAGATQALKDYADELGTTIGKDDELLLQIVSEWLAVPQLAQLGVDGLNNLLKVAADVAAGTGKDLDSIANAFVKVAGDGETALTKLLRAGIVFTDAQKEVYKSLLENNDELGAQQFLIDSLADKYEGAAESIANPFDILTKLFDDFQEKVGEKLLPALELLVPQIQAFLDNLANDPEFIGFLEDMVELFKDMGPDIKEIVPQLVDFAKLALPALISVMPGIISFLGLFNDALGDGDTSMKEFKDTLEVLYTPLNILITIIGEVINIVKTMFERLQDKNAFERIINPIVGIRSAFQDLARDIQLVIDWWNNLVGVQRSNPVNYATGAGVPGVNIAPLPRFGDDRRGIRNTYNISVNAIAPTAEVGRAVVDSLQAYQRIGGRVA